MACLGLLGECLVFIQLTFDTPPYVNQANTSSQYDITKFPSFCLL